MNPSSQSEEDPIQKALDVCKMTQAMIEITSNSLNGLRKQCTQSNDLIQHEILEKESKIIRLFSRQLVAKVTLHVERIPDALREYPKLEQLLGIIGINQSSIQGLKSKGVTLQAMLDMLSRQGDTPVVQLMKLNHANDEEIIKITTALYKLKKCTESQLSDRKNSAKRYMDLSYSWSNYQSSSNTNLAYANNSPKLPHHSAKSTSSQPFSSSFHDSLGSSDSPPTPPDSPGSSSSGAQPSPGETRRFVGSGGKQTPPHTPPLVKQQPGIIPRSKFRTTPPPRHRNILLRPDTFQSPGTALTKSKSHESQLPGRVNADIPMDMSKYLKKKPADLSLLESSSSSAFGITSLRKKSFDSVLSGGNNSPSQCSPKKSPPFYKAPSESISVCDSGIVTDYHPNKKNQLTVPPVSPRSMKHSISHRFQGGLIMGACDLCNKHVLLGKVCKYCKSKFHKDCASKAAPACGLPNELVQFFRQAMHNEQGSPGRVNHTKSLPPGIDSISLQHARSVPAFQDHGGSGSATSSCTSSTLSSPFFPCPSPASSAHPSPLLPTPSSPSQFTFPDVCDSTSSFPTQSTVSSIMQDSPPLNPPNNVDVINTNTSNDSDKSDKTLIDTGSSSEKALPALERVDSMESQDDAHLARANSITVTLREWDIPFESLKFGDKIGEGRFGTVFMGNWHGNVSIKLLKMDQTLGTQEQLQAFKLEVAMLRKTRHENLVLFMGACMTPPHLAIVTSLCRGKPLFHNLHIVKEKFNMNRAVIIASQIAQGMGYLHAKNIVHKDLKSKNVFLEGGKVVITDFGLFSVTKLCHGSRAGNWLSAPPDWLCYLAPEVMHKLTPVSHISTDLPFTKSSDIYAFGTIWYEIMAGEFPFKRQNPEVTIWQVGSGMKQPLSTIQASKDVKDLLMMCWRYEPSERKDFPHIMQYLERLPKKRLARSPSHPVHLSRSAESVF